MTIETREWTFYDRSEWPLGPWTGEPDKRQWVDEETGLPCLIVRGPVGALCGYVGVAEDHPWFGLAYHDCLDGCDEDDRYSDNHYMSNHNSPDTVISVHGGLTFSAACQEGDKEQGICHVGGPPVWWFGFDCAHSGDATPLHYPELRGSYRSIEYVTQQIEQLAKQLSEAAAEQEEASDAD